MKFKRLLTSALAVIMSVSMLAGCGGAEIYQAASYIKH